LLGAGLDTFPWRQPSFAKIMQLFAADYPASLAWTQERLRQRGLSKPSNLTYVPVDLEERRLGEQLIACGFKREASSFCSVLCVMQYLDGKAVDALLGFVATLARGSEIVFSFAPPDGQLNAEGRDIFMAFGRRPAALGEPWKSRLRPIDTATSCT